jgi:hypothetical protein
MAVFEKTKGQDTLGWDKATKTQTLKEGKDTLITLAGYDMAGLFVVSSNPAVCTIHERTQKPAPGKPLPLLMERHFVVTALTDGECEIQAHYSATNHRVLASAKIVVSNVKMAAKLVFFPGERSVGDTRMGTIFVVGGKGEHYDAAGGAVTAYKDNGGHTSDPTPPGLYVLGSQHHATTGTWPRSSIPYGAPLRLAADGTVEYLMGGTRWGAVNGPRGIVVKYMKEFFAKDRIQKTTAQCDAELKPLLFTDAAGKILRVKYWDLNDFGRWSWNMTQNNKLTPFYIHTTPENEWQTLKGERVAITNSHGCVHISPATRDKMIADGYLKRGTIFEVRKYSESAPSEFQK